MTAFLVRHDGVLINVHHIVMVRVEQSGFRFNGSIVQLADREEFNILIILSTGNNVQWNKEPRPAPETRALLHELTDTIRKLTYDHTP